MERKRKKILLIGVVLLILALFAGCAAQKVRDYEVSGFMGSYAGFQKGGEHQPNLFYINPNGSFRNYDKILIDHVVVYFKPGANKAVDVSDLNQLCEYFHKALISALKHRYTIVDKPGPGVLRIRSAITDVEPRGLVTGTLSTVVPIGAAVSVIKKTTTDSNMAVGRVSAEVELVDSITGERMAAAIDRREGGKKAIATKWADIEEAMNYWSEKIARRLDLQRGIQG